MDTLHLVGRILFAGFFIVSGANHFTKLDAMKSYAGSKGVPAPGLAVPFTGLLLLAGGLSVLLGLWAYIGLGLLILFLVPTAFMMHDFWAVPEDQKQAEMVNFMKNIALAGAALMMLLSAYQGWPYDLGG